MTAWWQTWRARRRHRRLLRQVQRLPLVDQARVLIRIIGEHAELRQALRQALGINAAGKPR